MFDVVFREHVFSSASKQSQKESEQKEGAQVLIPLQSINQ